MYRDYLNDNQNQKVSLFIKMLLKFDYELVCKTSAYADAEHKKGRKNNFSPCKVAVWGKLLREGYATYFERQNNAN